MQLISSARIALRALAANPLRSALTTLGVIIGVAAVVTTISIGTGARESVQAQISVLGTNLLTVIPGRVSTPGGIGQGGGTVQTLTLQDSQAIGDSLSDVEAVTAELSRSAQVVAGPYNDVITISGVTPSFPRVRDWQATEGAFFDEREMRSRGRVALLGKTARETLFPDADPIGQRIRINRVNFTVIGVMESKGASAFSDRDDVIFIPLPTAQKRLFGVDFVRAIYIKVVDQGRMERVIEQVEGVLTARHQIAEGAEPDFSIRNQADAVQAFVGVTRTITTLLAGIAAVSLVVGGIGIMNIMLVSVTERTREIGIRKAVGATRRNILIQFLVEAVTLSVAGGAIGILVALVASRAISALAGWSTIITPWAVLMAFGFAAAVGIFFGLYPAQRAASLDPIAALRYE